MSPISQSTSFQCLLACLDITSWASEICFFANTSISSIFAVNSPALCTCRRCRVASYDVGSGPKLIRGWNPWFMKKGDRVVAAESALLSANLAIGSHVSQSSWFSLVQARKKVSTSWFARSVCPSVLGWNAVNKLTYIPMRLQNDFHIIETNWGPQSEVIEAGMPCNQYTQ